MTGIDVKIKSYKVPSEFDMVKVIVQFIAITKGLSLSDTEIYALTYFIINGLSKFSREQLVSNKLLKTDNATANLVSRFRKFGIVNKTNRGEELSADFNSIYTKGIDAIRFQVAIHK